MAIGTGTAILIGAGLAAAGSVAGGLINSHSQDKANEANKELQLQNQEYQTSERLAAQSYNSPVNQSQLYEQAGFNKYLALGNMPSGETTAQTGVSPAVMKPNTAIGDMISQLGNLENNSINQYADLSIKDAQAEQLGIDNKIRSIQAQYEGTRQMLELDKMRSEIKNSNASATEKEKSLGLIDRRLKELDLNLKYLDEFNKARNDEQKHKADFVHEQAVGQALENESKKIYNSYLPQIQEAELKRINAAAAELWSQVAANGQLAKLTSEQAKTEFEMRVIKKALGKSEIKNQDIIQSYLGDQISTAIEYQKVQIRQGKQDIENPFRYFGNAIIGAGAASLGMKAAPTVVKGFSR